MKNVMIIWMKTLSVGQGRAATYDTSVSRTLGTSSQETLAEQDYERPETVASKVPEPLEPADTPIGAGTASMSENIFVGTNILLIAGCLLAGKQADRFLPPRRRLGKAERPALRPGFNDIL